ncbi:MAG: tRNA 2-thiouridine(34) synthase MnmA [Myxococcales bacterium]
MAQERVAVAMSGGVDSSVAAALLVREGYEVVGITLQLIPCEDRPLGGGCCSLESAMQARAVADKLGVDHLIVDARTTFEQQVLRPCWDEYAHGRTPNPCVLCNQVVKWGTLFDKARGLGARRIATGHYARIGTSAAGRPSLLRGSDPNKDQSYFLFSLEAEQIAATLLPLGGTTKPQVRTLARELGLATAERPESQDACFESSEDGFAESLRLRFGDDARPGAIVDRTGRPVGKHQGLHRYTLGQRHGLGVSIGGRAFVTGLDAGKNEVVVTTDPADLLSRELRVRLAGARDAPLPQRCQVQIRSRHRAVDAQLFPEESEGQVRVVFAEPQRAVTPGQAAVFYDGERVAGGGWIDGVLAAEAAPDVSKPACAG